MSYTRDDFVSPLNVSEGLRERIALAGQLERQRRYGNAGHLSTDSTAAFHSAKSDRENWMSYFDAENRKSIAVDIQVATTSQAPTQTRAPATVVPRRYMTLATPSSSSAPPPPEISRASTFTAQARSDRIPQRQQSYQASGKPPPPSSLARRPTLPPSPASTRGSSPTPRIQPRSSRGQVWERGYERDIAQEQGWRSEKPVPKIPPKEDRVV